MLDTGIWIRALGERTDAQAADCCAFFEAMVEQRYTMLMAAPTLAEIVRGGYGTSLPSTRSVQVVPVDRAVAMLLGEEFPQDVLKKYADKIGVTRTYLKYDALIFACAKRWGASMLIAYDDDHVALARHVQGLPVRRPDDFEDAQGVLAGVVPIRRKR